MTRIRFHKYQGTGNDFILFDPPLQASAFPPERIRFLCDRHFGVGGDGLLFIERGVEGRLGMRMFNPDGSEAEMCGNGLRCFAKHVVDRGLSGGRPEFPVDTRAGERYCCVFPGDDGLVQEVELGMGRPDFERVAVGLSGTGRFIDQPVENGGRRFRGTAVSMGNPHLVVFSPLTIEEAQVEGPRLESHPAFARRSNVEFVEQLGPRHLRVVVYERGAGITLACGTGTCASVAAAAAEGRLDAAEPVRVDLPGGTLFVRIDPSTGEVRLRGPAVRVFEGEIEIL